MLTLYVKTGCPYCSVVLAKLHDAEIPFEDKNIADEAVATELVERGGKRQVPYLVDSSREVEMYESADIVSYLDEQYSGNEDQSASGDSTSDPSVGVSS